jgi:hypothetical protein
MPFELIQARADAVSRAGGVAAVGIAQSSELNSALEKAKARGREELARLAEDEIAALKRRFLRELDEPGSGDYDVVFDTVSRTVAATLAATQLPTDLRHATRGRISEAWALMVLEPRVVFDAFEAQAGTFEALYPRLRESDVFAELDRRVQRFEAFRQKEGLRDGE